jgi:hypothetical protein
MAFVNIKWVDAPYEPPGQIIDGSVSLSSSWQMENTNFPKWTTFRISAAYTVPAHRPILCVGEQVWPCYQWASRFQMFGVGA